MTYKDTVTLRQYKLKSNISTQKAKNEMSKFVFHNGTYNVQYTLPSQLIKLTRDLLIIVHLWHFAKSIFVRNNMPQ